MVNQKTDNKEKILACLYKARGETVSGNTLSSVTGISRVAVWKHIKALKADGLTIESRPKGYVLNDPDNLLHPFCFPDGLKNRIHHFHEVKSTMDMARRLAVEGAPHLSCVIAEHQTGSRGRLNRKWISAEGGLWFTLILRPDLPPPMVYIFNFAASFCLSRVLKDYLSLNISVKWPNDLLLEGKKLSGLLSEMETRADMVSFLLMGIGLNVNNNPESEEFTATSLKNVLGRSVSRKEILIRFLTDFEHQIRKIDPGRIIDLWKGQTSTIGSRVRIETHDNLFEGVAKDVDETGALIIEDQQKNIKKIIYGDCFHT